MKELKQTTHHSQKRSPLISPELRFWFRGLLCYNLAQLTISVTIIAADWPKTSVFFTSRTFSKFLVFAFLSNLLFICTAFVELAIWAARCNASVAQNTRRIALICGISLAAYLAFHITIALITKAS